MRCATFLYRKRRRLGGWHTFLSIISAGTSTQINRLLLHSNIGMRTAKEMPGHYIPGIIMLFNR
jgi:hypothetical protein